MQDRTDLDRDPAQRWWNELPPHQRSFWLDCAGSQEAADAWRCFNRARTDAPQWIAPAIEGLSATVAACAPSASHAALLKAVGKLDGMAGVRLALVEGGRGRISLSKRKVVSATGEVIADDHQQWLEQQVRIDSGNVLDAYKRLKDKDLRLSCCHLENVYLVVNRGPSQNEFLQIEVRLEDEVQDRRLFPSRLYRAPAELHDLTEPFESEPLPDEQQARVRPLAYSLYGVFDVHRFVALASADDSLNRSEFRQKQFVRSTHGSTGDNVSSTEAFPGWDAAPIRAERIFADWSESSAGRSGARLSEHWTLHLNLHKDTRTQVYHANYVPAWTTKLKLAAVKPASSIYRLYGDLQKLDGRVGVPFAWFFFMLHGNRIPDAVGEQVIAGAESGEIVMPEHDYRVLKRWQAHTYGF